MKYKLFTAALFLAVTAPALAEQPPGPSGDQAQPPDNPRADRIMKRLDKNGDGVITPDEFKFRGERLFKDADVNHDGAVTLEELHKHHDAMEAKREAERKQMMAKQQARMDKMFESMDTNHDGKVTLAEAEAAAFKRMDKNGDGVLSPDELRPPRHEHMGRRHHMRPDGGFPPPPPPGAP